MSKEGRKGKTPLITVEIPHPDEKVRYMIGAELVEEWYNDKLEFDVVPNDVRLIGRDPDTGRITLDESFTATHWDEIQEFLDDVRHRFAESLFDELLEYVRMHMADISVGGGPPLVDEEPIGVPEEPGVWREEDMVIAWLRDTMGLEGRARPSVSLSNIARSRLKRGTDPARKVVVREARALMKMWRDRD